MNDRVSVILLAGGHGTRMQNATPKQFLELNGKPIALHSLEQFIMHPEISEVVVVCAQDYRHLFTSYASQIQIKFAEPGDRRQDSVYNGFREINPRARLACIHDSARPFVTLKIIHDLIEAADIAGAAATAMPLKFTIKEADDSQIVIKTHDRSRFYEIQTPQAVRPELLEEGFAIADRQQLTVTDDVSLVELLKLPVKLVPGCYTNIKVTTPDDLLHISALKN